MNNIKLKRLASACIAALCLSAAPASAVIVTKVGTWSTAPDGPNPGGLATGGKFVIQADYIPTEIVALPSPDEDDRTTAMGGPIDPARYFRAQLTNPGSFQLFIPLQGLGTVASQSEADHYDINANDCGGPCGFARTAEIQFFDPLGTQFRGFEFESDFMAGGLVFEMFTADVSFGGPTVTNSTAQVVNGDGGFGIDIRSVTLDVRSEDLGTSGGILNPGVFLSDAVPVIAEAGAPLAYSAGTLTVTTNAGTALVTDPAVPPVPGALRTAPSVFDQQPRQADNDLGAARTDGEDFLTFGWTVNGAGVTGDQAGTRLNRIVQGSLNGPVFVNDGSRTVDNVNVQVGIANSGLTRTTDTVAWSVQVTEDMTGLSGTDAVGVSYTNALPSIANATATASGPGNLGLDFALSGVDDPDLAVNALIPDFELLTKQVLVDGIDQSAFFDELLALNFQSVSNADLVNRFGVGAHNFLVTVTDLAGATADRRFDFEVLAGPSPAPEPSTLALLGIAAAGLAFGARRRNSSGGRLRNGGQPNSYGG